MSNLAFIRHELADACVRNHPDATMDEINRAVDEFLAEMERRGWPWNIRRKD